ncbi:MAG TPA: ElyC/SanA/YdcF family protein [Flavobacteriales bacterium]|nr:ElyC/SanA/YdcF family protein [Flavobacteriales bacterium]
MKINPLKKLKALYKVRWFRWSVWIAGFLIMFVLISTIWINAYTRKFLYDDVKRVPTTNVAMVLGTSKILPDGRRNLFFEYRIRATVELYNAGKINLIVVSGDNSRENYDEPGMMKEELVKRGIPACKITCDFAGFRTFDSVLRMKKVFKQNKFIVVSQKFHNQRAVFIGRKHGMEIIGFNAKDVKGSNGLKTHIREYFARAKAVIDLYIWPAKVKFLGKAEVLSDC